MVNLTDLNLTDHMKAGLVLAVKQALTKKCATICGPLPDELHIAVGTALVKRGLLYRGPRTVVSWYPSGKGYYVAHQLVEDPVLKAAIADRMPPDSSSLLQ